MKRNKWIFTLLLIGAVGFISIAATRSNIYKQIRKSQSLINDVYRYLITHYVDDLDIEKYTRISIDNMLMDLDPYTVFMEKEEKSGIELLTKGKYGGVGIQIGKREKELTVISPMDDSPAKRMGILSGDVIVKIDTVDVSSVSMDEAAKLIRGQKGTIVVLTIDRFGVDELMDFPLTREEIKVKDVSYSGLIDESTGYIRLTRFSRNSAIEMKKAVDELMAIGINSLVIDLRDNPGGLLNSAVDILDLFIEKDELLVWTEGKTEKSKRQYFSKSNPTVPSDLKVAVLINNGSASASEIVAGTLQDFDRAIIVGRQSFGKGLVQTVYPLDKDRSLKMTTAKYYIPSGRLIQKDGYLPDELFVNDEEEDSLFFTIGGRQVSSGGGISPDYSVDLKLTFPVTSACLRRGLFFTYVQKNKHTYSSFDDVTHNQYLMSHFESFVDSMELDIRMKGEIPYLEAKEVLMDLDSTNVNIQDAVGLIDEYFENKTETQFSVEYEDLKRWLLSEFANQYDGKAGQFNVVSKKDNDIQKAIQVMNDPVVYTESFIPQ
ncbi:MAG: S41 family peptidase [Candidatus Marinimicrobia bacterium]|nr:S41 family peptidase [Candidatus Neomarinimicrobiota bacterium]MBT3960936.1 S41 family peptidase [Candidatus Neomarinimicrobiota bacterium]MBT4384070.1 S41 family peptidase [Candidatus Neomarinimicrobiota bacterium]MBT4637137.1 S41 family peptidase [Candidatus Neomarinimicrobiota bacterium]MBT6471307.1 S41 family peptidase [Candidatus Neomarinimicrobiota bacterium]